MAGRHAHRQWLARAGEVERVLRGQFRRFDLAGECSVCAHEADFSLPPYICHGHGDCIWWRQWRAADGQGDGVGISERELSTAFAFSCRVGVECLIVQILMTSAC